MFEWDIFIRLRYKFTWLFYSSTSPLVLDAQVVDKHFSVTIYINGFCFAVCFVSMLTNICDLNLVQPKAKVKRTTWTHSLFVCSGWYNDKVRRSIPSYILSVSLNFHLERTISDWQVHIRAKYWQLRSFTL